MGNVELSKQGQDSCSFIVTKIIINSRSMPDSLYKGHLLHAGKDGKGGCASLDYIV